MKLREIIADWLKGRGLDGLYNDWSKCGCGGEDLMVCGCPNENECVAARRVKVCAGESCEHYGDCGNHDTPECYEAVDVAVDVK